MADAIVRVVDETVQVVVSGSELLQPYVTAAADSATAAATSAGQAATSADLAAAYALALEVGTAGGWYHSLAEGAADTVDGEGFFVVYSDGRFVLAENVAGVGTVRAEFQTTASAGYVTPEQFGATGSGDEGAILLTAMNAAIATGAVLRLRRGRTYSLTQLTTPDGLVIEGRNAVFRLLSGLTGTAVSFTFGNSNQLDRLNFSSPGTEANATMITIGDDFIAGRIKISCDTQRGGQAIGSRGQNVEIERLITRNVDRPIHLDNGSSDTPTTDSYIGFLDCQSYVRGFRATNCDRWAIGGYRMRDRSPNSQNTAVGSGSLAGSSLTITTTTRGTWYSSASGGARIYNSDGVYVGSISGAPTGSVYPMTGLTGALIIGGVINGRRMADRVGHNGLLISDCCDYEVGEGLIHEAGEHAIRISGSMRKSIGGMIGRVTVDSCGGCAFKVNALSRIITENVTIGPIYGIDVGDFADSGTGENKEFIRISHASEIRINGAYSDSRDETNNSSYIVKLNNATSVTVDGLGGLAANSGIIFDKTSDVGGTFATGSISGTTMTITAVSSGAFEVGDAIYDGTTYCGAITALGTGTGGTGTYTLSKSSTVASTALAGNPREAGPVTGVRVNNYGSVIDGSNNAVVFDMDGMTIGEIFIDFAGARGWTTNVASFAGTPIVSGPIVFSGVISGSAAPIFSNAPADANVRANLMWSGRRVMGQVSLFDGQYQGWQNVVSAAFDRNDVKGSQIIANASGATGGLDTYGAAYEFTRVGKTRRGAALALRQTGTAENNTGVEILVGGTVTGSDAIRAAFQVTHERTAALIDGVASPTVKSGWAQIFVDSADGDLKIMFGDGVVKTIVVDS